MMTAATIAYLITGALALSLGIAFVITSIREAERRAALVSALGCLLLAAAWSGWYAGFSSRPGILILPAAAVWLAVLLFFFPTGRVRGLRILELGERVDERDVIFAREEYEPGTDRYEEYYRRRPEKKAIDDKEFNLERIDAAIIREEGEMEKLTNEQVAKVTKG